MIFIRDFYFEIEVILIRKVAVYNLGVTEGSLKRGHPYCHALSNVRAFRTTQNMKMTSNNPSIVEEDYGDFS